MEKRWIVAGSVVLALVAIGLALWLSAGSNPAQPAGHQSAPAKPAVTASVPKFDHIVMVMLENESSGDIIGNTQAPYLNKLAQQYALASNYHALFHPSLPNYIALTGGTNAGITTDCSPGGNCLARTTPITGEIAASGRSWKAYEQSMPAPCYRQNAGDYAVRHNPFVYYPAIADSTASCRQHDVPYSQLASDIAAKRLPNFVFITPNICDDMHSCPIATGDKWLAVEIPKLLQSDAFTQQNSLLVITFDESSANSSSNQVATILAGPRVKRGYQSGAEYTHYSLLHTIETAWRLQPLTANDRQASVLREFFR